MVGVGRTLDARNRERFSQQLTAFKQSVGKLPLNPLPPPADPFVNLG